MIWRVSPVDKGPGFISKDTLAVVQGGLRALLIHGATRYPEGHGAVERFHRTAHDQVLRSLDGAADVDPACEALTLRLRHFLNRYNDTPHETLGKDTTPRQRWEQGRELRFPRHLSCNQPRLGARNATAVSTGELHSEIDSDHLPVRLQAAAVAFRHETTGFDIKAGSQPAQDHRWP